MITCCAEDLAKALGDGTPLDPYRPLPNRFARWACEQLTVALSARLGALVADLDRFLVGDTGMLRKAMSDLEFARTRIYLDTLDPFTMAVEDYGLLIDWLIQRYLPDDFILAEADRLAVRAVLMGKLQRNLGTDPRLTDPMVDTLAALVPTEFAKVPMHVLTPTEISILRYGRAHAGEAIRGVTQYARHRIATICLEAVQGSLFGQREGTWRAAQVRLFDDFANLHRDFRRIAVTETGEMVMQGYVAAAPMGSYVRRIEAYKGACDFCKSLHGRVYQVVSADDPHKDGDTMIWPGKTNLGRSVAPMKNVNGALVPRTANELYWCAAGTQHPNCRGSWAAVTRKPPAVSQEFFEYTNKLLADATR